MALMLWRKLANRQFRALRPGSSSAGRRGTYRPRLEQLEQRELLDGDLVFNSALDASSLTATDRWNPPPPMPAQVSTTVVNSSINPSTYGQPVTFTATVTTLSDGGNGKLSNYAVSSINGSLAVTPAPLTVTPANASRTYGTPNPVLTGAIAGIQNGDNITASYRTTAGLTSPAGTYPIT